MAIDLVRGDTNCLPALFDNGDGVPICCFSLEVPEAVPGVFGEWVCWRTLEKNKEERLRGGSKGAIEIDEVNLQVPS
jgi:hypothetical protein